MSQPPADPSRTAIPSTPPTDADRTRAPTPSDAPTALHDITPSEAPTAATAPGMDGGLSGEPFTPAAWRRGHEELDTSERQRVAGAVHEHRHPSEIGPYRILELLGEGGMGSVYKAEQRSPIKRTVAVKVIKPGFGSEEVIARFESERQALARMDHPNIAKVLDAGVAFTGSPYFVMEYVPGLPLTRFADDNKLTIQQRLELFIPLCEAIAHAHTKAILHRDIKAANVLAFLGDGKPVVKVIDFGIAKALTGDRLTDRTFNTARGHVIGTYDSMSPEQADGSPDIDTRTDVYSLGVLLYELLTGLKPFDHTTLQSASDDEIKRIIREVEPSRPSTRLNNLGERGTTLAAARRAHLDSLSRVLRRELEWIPLKAMRKERDRRYASPLQLAEDIGNYLAGRPLLAGPESRTYRARKLLKRHRTSLAASAVMVVLLATGVGLYIHSIRREQARTRAALLEAEKQTAVARAVSQFQSDMLSSADPDKLLGGGVTVLQATHAAIRELDAGKLQEQPLVEAAVRMTIGTTLHSLGRLDEADGNFQRALHLRRQALPAVHPDIAATQYSFGMLLLALGKLADSDAMLSEALQTRRRVLRAGHADIAQSLLGVGLLRLAQGRLADAEPPLRESLEIRRKALPLGRAEIAQSLDTLATLLLAQGRIAEAEPLLLEARELRPKALPAGHPDVARGLSNLAGLMMDQGKFAEAESLYREALDVNRKAYPSGHVETAKSLNNLAVLFETQGKPEKSVPLMRDALEASRQALPAGHPELAGSVANLAAVLRNQKSLDEAEPLFREALEIYQQTLPGGHPDIATTLANFAWLRSDQGKFTEAEPLARKALEMRRNLLPSAHPQITDSLVQLSWLLRQQGKRAESEQVQRELLGIYRRDLSPNHPNLIRGLYDFAWLLWDLGKLAEAEAAFGEVLAMRRESQPAGHPDIAGNLLWIGVLRTGRGRSIDAEPSLREAVEIYRKSLPATHPDLALSLHSLAAALADQGKLAEAEPLFREALEIRKSKYGASGDPTTQSAGALVGLLDKAGRHTEAAALRAEHELLASTSQPTTTPATSPLR